MQKLEILWKNFLTRVFCNLWKNEKFKEKGELLKVLRSLDANWFRFRHTSAFLKLDQSEGESLIII